MPIKTKFAALFILLTSFVLSENKIDSLISQLNSIKEDTLKVELLCRISSEVYFEKVKNPANFEKGFKYSRQALALSEKLNYLPGKAKSYLQIGNFYFKSILSHKLSNNFFNAIWYGCRK